MAPWQSHLILFQTGPSVELGKMNASTVNADNVCNNNLCNLCIKCIRMIWRGGWEASVREEDSVAGSCHTALQGWRKDPSVAWWCWWVVVVLVLVYYNTNTTVSWLTAGNPYYRITTGKGRIGQYLNMYSRGQEGMQWVPLETVQERTENKEVVSKQILLFNMMIWL